MTKYEKIVLGALAILIIAVVGLAFSLKKSEKNNFGSAQTVATYATGDGVTNAGGLYLYDTDSNSGLEVAGPSHFAGTSTFSGAVSGIATSSLSTLTVSGATALNGGLTMDTNKFSVADTSGNTLIAGTLGVTGTSTFGIGSFSSTLGVTGLSSFGSALFSGTVGVTGTSTLGITNTGALTATTFAPSGITTAVTTTVQGGFCIWNGTEWTNISFSSGSTTPAYATSTTCL